MRKIIFIICLCLSLQAFAQNFRELDYNPNAQKLIVGKDASNYNNRTGHYYTVPFTLKSKSEVMEYLSLIGAKPLKFSKTAKFPIKGEGNYTYFHSAKNCKFDKENETVELVSYGGYYQKIVFDDTKMEVALVDMYFKGAKNWDEWCKGIINDGYTLLHEELLEDNIIKYTYTKMGEYPNFYVTLNYNRDFAIISISRKGDAQNIIEHYIQEFQNK